MAPAEVESIVVDEESKLNGCCGFRKLLGNGYRKKRAECAISVRANWLEDKCYDN